MNFNKIKSAALSGLIAAASVAGSFSAAAPALSANAADANYARLLQYSLYFYDTNMCGNVGSSCAISWRGNCHADDEVPGGYHDAGDHVMFGLPQGFTASMLEWSYYEFKDAYDATGQGAHFKVVADYFADFFKKSTKLSGDNVTSLLYQKGDGEADHNYWGPPEQQGGGRPMKWTSNGAGDVAADYAAALALHYLNFGDSESLKYAEALYSYATRNPGTVDHGTFYSNKTSQDEIANAAGWLYMATKKENYKNDCASKQDQYLGWCDGWENRYLGAACVYAHITGDWSKVNGFLGSKCNGSGYLFMDEWGSARLNASMQFTALVASKNSNADYTSWCQGQMDMLLGNNPKNTCLVTGFAPNSAKYAHHRAASVNYEGNYEHVLIGALVGGPKDSNWNYVDLISDYVCNEVAIDYNAGLVGSAAGLYHFFKSGKADTSIEGVTKIYNGSGGGGNTTTPDPTDPPKTTQGGNNNTNPTVTTKAPSTVDPGPTADGDKVLSGSDLKPKEEEGDDGSMNITCEFSVKGYTSCTAYYTLLSNDTQSSGAFGTWTGSAWKQEDFENVKADANKQVVVDYKFPSDVGSTVKLMLWWPKGDAVQFDKIVLHGGSGSGGNTSKPTTTKAPVTTTKPTTTKATTTKATTTKAPQTQAPQPVQTQPVQQGVSVTIYGDANCDGYVGIADATAILQSIGNPGQYALSAQGAANADVVQPKGLTGNDALAIQCYDAKLIQYSQFPLAQLPNF